MLRCCGLEIKKDNYEIHCNYHKNKKDRLPCPVSTCKKDFLNKNNLERHFGSHHPHLCSSLVGLPIPPNASYQQISAHLIKNQIPFSKHTFSSTQYKQHPIEILDDNEKLSRSESERLTNQYIEDLEDNYDNFSNQSSNYNIDDLSVEVDLEDFLNRGNFLNFLNSIKRY